MHQVGNINVENFRKNIQKKKKRNIFEKSSLNFRRSCSPGEQNFFLFFNDFRFFFPPLSRRETTNCSFSRCSKHFRACLCVYIYICMCLCKRERRGIRVWCMSTSSPSYTRGQGKTSE